MLSFPNFGAGIGTILGEGTATDVWVTRITLLGGLAATVAGILTIIFKIVEMNKAIDQVRASAQTTEKQMFNNGGSTVRDKIDVIDARIERIANRTAIQFDAVQDRQLRASQRMTRLEREFIAMRKVVCPPEITEEESNE